MSALTSEMRHQRRLALERFVESRDESIEAVRICTEAETAALGSLAATIQNSREQSLAAVATALKALNDSRLEEKGSPITDDGLVPVSVESNSKEFAVQNTLNTFIEETLRENARLHALIDSAKHTTVPIETFTAVQNELAATKSAHALSAKHIEELRSALGRAGGQPRVLGSNSNLAAGKKPASVMDDATSTYLRHPMWSDFVAEMEGRLVGQTVAEEQQEELLRLKPRLAELEQQVEELNDRLNTANTDAQATLYQNGVLIQQLASLLHRHHMPVMLPPVKRNDLSSFGSFLLPETQYLTGVATVEAADDSLPLNVYSINDVTQLVERNAELTRQLFLAVNGEGAQGDDSSSEGMRRVSPEGAASPARIGTKRSRMEEPQSKYDVGAVDLVDGQLRLKSLSTVGTQCDALPVLLQQQSLEWPKPTSGNDSAPSSWKSTAPTLKDPVGAERLIATALAAWKANGLTSDEILRSEREHRQLLEEALLESQSLVTVLEGKVIDLMEQLDKEQVVAQGLRQELATIHSHHSATKLLPSLMDSTLTAPIHALSLLEKSLRQFTNSGLELAVAPEPKNSTLSAPIGELAIVASSLAQQESTIIEALQATRRSMNLQSGANEESRKDLVGALQDEISQLRQSLVQAQEKLSASYNTANEERMKHLSLLEHVWSVDVTCQELRDQHDRDMEQLQTMVPLDTKVELERTIETIERSLQEQQALHRQTQEELERRNGAFAEQEQKLQQEMEDLRNQLAVVQQERETAKQQANDLNSTLLSTQTDVRNLQYDLSTMENNKKYLENMVAAKDQEIAGLLQEVDRQRGMILSQRVTKEEILKMFPEDESVRLTIVRSLELESENAQLRQSLTACESKLTTCQLRLKALGEEKSSLEHRIVILESSHAAALERANARVNSAEDAISSVRFQTSTLQGELDAITVQLDAALQREKVHEERIAVLSMDPTSECVRKYGVQYTKDMLAQMEELNDRLKGEEQRRQDIESQMKGTQATLDSTAKELENSRNNLKALAASEEHKSKSLEATSQELEATKTLLTQTIQNFESARKMASVEQTNSKAMAAQIVKLKGTIEAKESEVLTVANEKADLSQRMTATEKKLADVCELAEGLKAKLQATETSILKEKSINASLMEDNIKLKDQVQKLTVALTEASNNASTPARSRSSGVRPQSQSLTSGFRRH